MLGLERSHVVGCASPGRLRAGRGSLVQAMMQLHEPLHVPLLPPLAFASSSCAFINASLTSALCS